MFLFIPGHVLLFCFFLEWQNIVDEGYAATQILAQLHEAVIENGELSDQQKSAIAEKMAVREEGEILAGLGEWVVEPKPGWGLGGYSFRWKR